MRAQGVFKAVGLLIFVAGVVSTQAALKLELVVTNLSKPLYVLSPPGDANRLFILLQHSGQIRIFDKQAGVLKATPFLTITSLNRGGEEGLLGMAFHPGYATNGFFYLNLTPSGSPRRTEIVRFKAQGDPMTSEVADPNSRKLILTYNQPESNHNGGWLGFGPDGYLYIAAGDGGGGDDMHGTIGNGQDRSTLLGKILRIDPSAEEDGDPAYTIPDGNPFKGSASMANEIWAFGLRNPWRCSFDRASGHLWVGDVGQNTREEIDVIPNGVGGLNLGWRPREGRIQNPAYPSETTVTPRHEPVFDYSHALGVSVTGGYVYRGNGVPEFRSKYIFADYGSGRFWTTTLQSVDTNGTTVEISAEINPILTGTTRRVDQISSFGEDDQGEIYVCDRGSETAATGAIYRIVSDTPAAPQVTDVQREGGDLIFSFQAAASKSFVIEASSLLGQGSSWNDVMTVASATTNRTVSVTNAVTGEARYFRIRGE
jgi:glucose/arabinose dehydrogenase